MMMMMMVMMMIIIIVTVTVTIMMITITIINDNWFLCRPFYLPSRILPGLKPVHFWYLLALLQDLLQLFVPVECIWLWAVPLSLLLRIWNVLRSVRPCLKLRKKRQSLVSCQMSEPA
jgi:hypothetical protein